MGDVKEGKDLGYFLVFRRNRFIRVSPKVSYIHIHSFMSSIFFYSNKCLTRFRKLCKSDLLSLDSSAIIVWWAFIHVLYICGNKKKEEFRCCLLSVDMPSFDLNKPGSDFIDREKKSFRLYLCL